MDAVIAARAALKDHERRYPWRLADTGTPAGDEWSRLYDELIRARWDAGDTWVRSIWSDRP